VTRLAISLLSLLLLSSCAGSRPTTPRTEATEKATASPPQFIEDDYPRALAEAKAKKLPLFVDAWAPWCHTCLSLRAYVLHHRAMASLSPKFVWLAIDTEKPTNAAFVEKFPLEAWPTLWVVDAQTEKPVLKWVGAATVSELIAILEDLTDAGGGEPMAAYVRGNRAAAERNTEVAIKEYRASLATAPKGWSKRPRVVEVLSTQLSLSKDRAGCVEIAETELAAMPAGTSKANVALNGLECALALPEDSAQGKARAAMASEVARIAEDIAVPILADDRSALYEELVTYRKESGDKEGAKKAARSWATFLETEATNAHDASARAVFDSHRLLAYAELGELQKAVPMLLQSEKDFPDDYNPPTRLAWAYMKLGRLDEATATMQRALPKAYGPRKLTVLKIKCDLELAKGDKAAARATLEEAVKLGESMTLKGAPAKVLVELKKRLDAM
jgi:thioredoxin-like negative regulator of GroEL